MGEIVSEAAFSHEVYGEGFYAVHFVREARLAHDLAHDEHFVVLLDTVHNKILQGFSRFYLQQLKSRDAVCSSRRSYMLRGK